ncbi:MAG: transaldolase [Arenicella sp.]
MPSLFHQLQQTSTIVADTGDLHAIKKFKPQDATTNPSLVLAAIQSGQYDDLIKSTLHNQDKALKKNDFIEEICDQIIVTMGSMILQNIPGRVSTEVDARLSFDTQASVLKARKLIDLYAKAGIDKHRVLIKLAATWEGIRAANILEQEGIQCNLTLIFSVVQARACAEAGVYLISPFVGRILDWHKQQNPAVSFTPDQEPGVRSVHDIYHYFKQHQYETIIMGASFRNIGEIMALSGCDRLTISPSLLEELTTTDDVLKTSLTHSGKTTSRPAPIDEAEFRWQFNSDAMATEKLAEGIRGFEADQLKLESLLIDKLKENER